jgi:hypothetical protein
LIASEGGDPDQLIAAVRVTPHGTALLRRFAAIAR